eukprot:CAMPEP_0205911128 /NCGR_PEP_ID=MMETSP1325-20131115/4936_1 /ASSEMBLY_ACC=CAM_ASM_000708 /TAXON_ID=236786 /ORGANISM="Florenciella sp., Strain RCC1007" /LENGTH=154 /DNA_ID=CAMNT_0053277603 /DNA_START=31 /DNA_END=496 /DNA_ORIENTATION=-
MHTPHAVSVWTSSCIFRRSLDRVLSKLSSHHALRVGAQAKLLKEARSDRSTYQKLVSTVTPVAFRPPAIAAGAVEEEDVSVPTLILCGAEDGLTKQQGASVVMNFSNAGLQGEHVQCRIIARASYMLPWEKGVGESVAGFIDGLPLVQAYGTSA